MALAVMHCTPLRADDPLTPGDWADGGDRVDGADGEGPARDARSGGDATAGDITCPAPDATTADFYVGAIPTAATCAFRTITEALQAAALSSAPERRIHVSRGRYTAETGERFPLDLRGGISLEGEGRELTIIAGSSSARNYPQNRHLSAALLVGDPTRTTRIAHVTIESGKLAVARGDTGIICDAGNTAEPDSASRPNTAIDDVAMSRWATSVLVGTGSGRPGCNMRIVRSRFEQGFIGIWGGYLLDGGELPAMLQVGDAAEEDGNTFSGIVAPPSPLWGDGGAVSLRANLGRARVRGNSFRGVGTGVHLWGATSGPFEIVGNTFDHAFTGVYLEASNIDRLEDNTFHALEAGVLIDPRRQTTRPAYPEIRRARGNSFVGTVVGVHAFSDDQTGTSISVFDFGNPSDPGRNVFHCNASRDGGMVGADVAIENRPANGVTLFLSGNLWDRVPPTVGPIDWQTGVDGTEVMTDHPSALDLSGAGAHGMPCPGPIPRLNPTPDSILTGARIR